MIPPNTPKPTGKTDSFVPGSWIVPATAALTADGVEEAVETALSGAISAFVVVELGIGMALDVSVEFESLDEPRMA